MLDEKIEVIEYLCNPDIAEPRISANILFENYKAECKLDRVQDILTLIASHYLYDFCKGDIIDEETKKKVILILRIWCGFDNDVTKEELKFAKKECKEWFDKYPQAEGWLKTFYAKHCKEGKNIWPKYTNKRANELRTENIYKANAISYEGILAQTIARGPLKTYYLVVKKDYTDVVGNAIKDEKGEVPKNVKKRNIMKLIASYKILQIFHPEQKYVLLQPNRVLGWMGIRSDKKERWCLNYTWNNELLFKMESGEKHKKFYGNEEFLKVVDAQIREDVSEISKEEYIIYQDQGHQNELKEL